MSISETVDELISENSVMIFSKSNCPYSDKAKCAIQELGVEFYAIELDEREDGALIQNYLYQKTGQRTVPNIFIKRQHIGGSDDLAAGIKKGRVQSLLSIS